MTVFILEEMLNLKDNKLTWLQYEPIIQINLIGLLIFKINYGKYFFRVFWFLGFLCFLFLLLFSFFPQRSRVGVYDVEALNGQVSKEPGKIKLLQQGSKLREHVLFLRPPSTAGNLFRTVVPVVSRFSEGNKNMGRKTGESISSDLHSRFHGLLEWLDVKGKLGPPIVVGLPRIGRSWNVLVKFGQLPIIKLRNQSSHSRFRYTTEYQEACSGTRARTVWRDQS